MLVLRPASWLIGAPIVFYSYRFGGGEDFGSLCVLSLALSFPYCFWLFGWNDYYDHESDQINPRKRSPLYGSNKNIRDLPGIRFLLIFSGVLGLALSLLLPVETAVCLLTLFGLSYFYSVPPVRLKRIPFASALTSGLVIFLLFLAALGLGDFQVPLESYFMLPLIMSFHHIAEIIDFDADNGGKLDSTATMYGIEKMVLVIKFLVALCLISICFLSYAKGIQFFILGFASVIICFDLRKLRVENSMFFSLIAAVTAISFILLFIY